MKVLITGATGFLGSHLSELLIEQGHEVRALVRRSSKTGFLEALGAEIHIASLETGEGLREALEDVDAVVHGAAIVKARRPEEFHEVNVMGTRRLLDAVLEHRPGVKRFVFVSSLAAHGFGTNGDPRPLDAEPNPVTHYGKSKLAAERMVRSEAERLPVSVIRPPAIYGPRDSEMFAFFKIVNGRVVPFLGSAQNKLSLVYAPDCARAIYLCITKDHPSGRVYFVEDGRTYSQDEIVGHIEEALGKSALLKLPVPMQAVSAAAVGSELWGRVANKAMMLTRDKVNELRAQQVCCPAEPIREELGWEALTQFPEGARLSVEWYRSQGWL